MSMLTQANRWEGLIAHAISVAITGAILGVGMPAAAATEADPTRSEIAPVGPSPTIDRIKAAGKIVLGYRTDAAPMSSRDSAGRPVGYSVALCEEVADALRQQFALSSLAVEWVAVGKGYDDIEQRRVDLICANDAITLEHRTRVSFSIPVFPGGVSALVHRDAWDALVWTLEARPAPYEPLWRGEAPATLQHRIYSAISGSATLDVLKTYGESLKLMENVAPVDSYDAGVSAVLERRSDVLFADRAQLLSAVRRSPSAKDLRVLSQRFEFVTSALALARNDDGFRLEVDRALTGFYQDPRFGALYTANFGPPDADAITYFRSLVAPK
jgi:ABC-type amino acid transport substrate-binding protein